MYLLLRNQIREMKFSELYNYPPFHNRFTTSRVRQSASRLSQMKRLGNYSSTAAPEEVALFLYSLSASQGTRFIFDTVMREHELVNAKGSRFVSDLAEVLSDSAEVSKVKKVVIGMDVSVIEYKDGYKELYTLGDDFELGTFEQFDNEFLQDLANSIAITEPA